MYGQEEEEAQYRLGCFANEFQAAYTLSRLTQEYPCEQRLVDASTAAGRFAVVLQYPEFCRHTDALLGMATRLVSEHATEAEALAALAAFGEQDDSEYCYYLAGPRPPQPPPPSPAECDDIPF